MDGYLRVQAVPARRHASDDGDTLSPTRMCPDAPDALLFIDIEPSHEFWPDRLVEGLRFAPEEALLRATHVVVRVPSKPELGELDAVHEYIAKRWQREPDLGAVFLKAGMPAAELSWRSGVELSAVETGAILARCRAIELGAMLEWGNALWTPSGYHYQLPSGEHRATFVRLADAMRQQRDPEVLAWWLLPQFCESNRALVLDSSSLLPLVFALRESLNEADIRLGNVAVRDAYPETPIEDRALIEHVGGEGIVTVVSVSSSGRSVATLAQVLEDRRGDSPWRLEVLVARAQLAAAEWDPSTPGLTAPWVQMPEDAAPVDPDQPYLIIDPQTFANTVIPEPSIWKILSPPHVDRRIDDLLGFYDLVDGIGIECEHHSSTVARRGRTRGAVRFYPERLLLAEGFLDSARSRLQSTTESFEDGRPAATMRDLAKPDALVVLDEDVDLPGFDGYLDVVASELAADGPLPRIIVVPRRRSDEADERLRLELDGCGRVVLLALGLVTGGTLQALDLRVLRACIGRGQGELEVSALVVHARPASFDEWQAARSSFHGRLAALWVTYLPWKAPHRAEIELLNLLGDASDAATEFMTQRYDIVNHATGEWAERCADFEPNEGIGNPAAALWCANQDAPRADLPHLVSGSRFGHEASMLATFVGVGAAMQRARLEQRKRGGPPWLRFDLTKTNFTYFEAIISGAILRWLRPSEGQWDSESKDVEDVIREMWERTTEEPGSAAHILLGELLLAAAQGKVPRAAFGLLRRLADELITNDPENSQGIQCGVALLDLASPVHA